MGRRPWSNRKTVEECQALSIFGLWKVKAEIERMGGMENIKRYVSIRGPIEFTSTPCHFGSERYWFICPVCGKRVAKLYRPEGKEQFACRTCYNLTYQSCKEHDKRLDSIIKNPQLFDRITSLKHAGLVLKAYDKLMRSKWHRLCI